MSKRWSVFVASLVFLGWATERANAAEAWGELTRYQPRAARDTLTARLGDDPGLVVLDRDFVRLQRRGETVGATVEREWILVVGDAVAMEAYRTQHFPEYPGRKIRDVTAYKLSGDDLIEAGVRTRSGDALEGCSTGHSYRVHDVDFGALARGDVLGLRIRYELVGQNPSYVHPIEGPIPVLQSDVTIEVPRELMEGPASGGFDWWAGSWPTAVERKVWEKPTTWRFRWGVRDVPMLGAGDAPRVVASAWVYDPTRERGGFVATTDGARRVGTTENIGPTLSAESYANLGSRSDRTAPSRPTEAAFGRLSWGTAGERYVSALLKRCIEDGRQLASIVENLRKTSPDDDAFIRRVVDGIAERIETADVPLGWVIYDVRRPIDTYRSKCGTALDKAVLACAMLRAGGVEACPALATTAGCIPALSSVEIFDTAAVVVETKGGRTLVDVESGRIGRDVATEAWSALLLLHPKAESIGLLAGADLLALVD
jgi:hypothetical protein